MIDIVLMGTTIFGAVVALYFITFGNSPPRLWTSYKYTTKIKVDRQ